MDDPDVILRVDADADRLTQIPAVGQRLGHIGSTSKRGAIDRALALRVRCFLQRAGGDAEGDD